MLTLKRLHKASISLAILTIILAATSGWAQSSGPKVGPKDLTQKIRQMREAAKKDREESIQKQKAKLAPLLEYSIAEIRLALTIKVMATYSGAKIAADNQEHTFLGLIDDELSADSIFNEYGTYGSQFTSGGIWNSYGKFGGEHASLSPFNKYSSTPPLIVKNEQVIGRLTVNKNVAGAVDPNWLKTHFTY